MKKPTRNPRHLRVQLTLLAQCPRCRAYRPGIDVVSDTPRQPLTPTERVSIGIYIAKRSLVPCCRGAA